MQNVLSVFDIFAEISVCYNAMIDLHTHTLFSDGVLLPAELVQRAAHAGYRAIALTDHMDMSNIDFIIPRIVEAAKALSEHSPVQVIPGAELTHLPLTMIAEHVAKARKLGARIVIVHGETIAEPVIAGTNRAGIEAQADILSHPGLISIEDAALAQKKGVALEITARKGHSLTNGHVAKVAMATGAAMVINTDCHGPEDLISRERAAVILRAAGIPEESIETVFMNSQKFADNNQEELDA